MRHRCMIIGKKVCKSEEWRYLKDSRVDCLLNVPTMSLKKLVDISHWHNISIAIAAETLTLAAMLSFACVKLTN